MQHNAPSPDKLHVGLENSAPPRDGTFELNDAVGIALRWRKCDAQATPSKPSAPPSGAGDEAAGTSDQGRAPTGSRDDDGGSAEDGDAWQDDDHDSDEWWWWSKVTPIGRFLGKGAHGHCDRVGRAA